MELMYFLLCWSPVLLLAVLAVLFKRPALQLAIWGTLFTLGLVLLAFETPLSVALLAAVDGALTTMPIALVISAGILLSSLLMVTGSFKRIVDWFMGGVRDAYHRSLLITLGVGNFMEGAGVLAETVVAPMLRVAGVSPSGAAALSIICYAGLMTLEMGGIIVVVLSLVTGLPLGELGVAAAWLSLPATLLMAACVPLFLPQRPVGPGRLFLTLACGAVAGLVAVAVASWLSVTLSGLAGGLALIVLLVLLGTRRLELDRAVFKDLAPFALLLAALLLVNTVGPIKELAFERLTLRVSLVPVHSITLRPLFSAYLYIFAALGLALRLQRPNAEQRRRLWREGLNKCWRAALAMGLFGAMGQMIAFSGYRAGFAQLDQAHNLPWLLANGLSAYSGQFYPVFVPLLGWVGTFLTGYGVASLMLFGQLQVQSAALLGVSATWLAAGLAVGASLGSISAPFKVALATPMCGALGREGEILRLTIPLGAAACLVLGLVLWIII